MVLRRSQQRDMQRKEFFNEILPKGDEKIKIDGKKSEWEKKLEKIESSK